MGRWRARHGSIGVTNATTDTSRDRESPSSVILSLPTATTASIVSLVRKIHHLIVSTLERVSRSLGSNQAKEQCKTQVWFRRELLERYTNSMLFIRRNGRTCNRRLLGECSR